MPWKMPKGLGWHALERPVVEEGLCKYVQDYTIRAMASNLAMDGLSFCMDSLCVVQGGSLRLSGPCAGHSCRTDSSNSETSTAYEAAVGGLRGTSDKSS